jgi:hypothetical protein
MEELLGEIRQIKTMQRSAATVALEAAHV